MCFSITPQAAVNHQAEDVNNRFEPADRLHLSGQCFEAYTRITVTKKGETHFWLLSSVLLIEEGSQDIFVCLYVLMRWMHVLLSIAVYLLLWPSTWVHQAKHVCDNFLSLSQKKILKLKICHRTLEGLKSCQKSSESARSAELSVALDDCWHEWYWGPGLVTCLTSLFVDLCYIDMHLVCIRYTYT